MASKKKHWTQTPKGRKRMAALVKARHAAKKTSKTSIPLDMIPDRPARKVIKAVETAWQAVAPLRMDEHATQQAKMDILFGLIALANKVLR